MPDNATSRILSFDQLKKTVDLCRKQNKTIVATNGCFDILHIGHTQLLNSAKELVGDKGILIVGINSDDSVKKLKGPNRPLVPEHDRAKMLANLRAVDYVTVFDDQYAVDFLKAIKPDIYVKGGDYSADSLPEAAFFRDEIARNEMRIEFIKLVSGKSTTGLIEKINKSI